MRQPGASRRIAEAHERSVAPVVITSSTSRTCRPASRSGRRTEKAPSTLPARSRRGLRAWLAVLRVRRTLRRSTSTPSCAAIPSAMYSDWLYPRRQRLKGCSGNGTTTSTVSYRPLSRRQRPYHSPIARAVRQAPRYLKPWISRRQPLARTKNRKPEACSTGTMPQHRRTTGLSTSRQ